MDITKIIESELSNYQSQTTEISESVYKSAYKRIKRISFFQNRGGEQNKVDELGRYSYWLNSVKVYIDSTVKNLRIDTKNFLAFSINPVKDYAAVFITNAVMKDWLWDTNRAEQLQEDVEYYVGWGNILWEKVKGGYETCDLANTFVINETAKSVDESPIITRYQLTQSELRRKEGVYKNIEEVIQNCGNKQFSSTNKTTSKNTTNPIYEIYKRDGEVSEETLFKAQGKKGGDKNKFVFARFVVAGLTKSSSQNKYILFSEEIKDKTMRDLYKEAHLGPYTGTWIREGIYEVFFDYQVAINALDNDISEGLEWAAKVIFRSEDSKTYQNIRTDIESGRIINSKDLAQVDVRLRNLDQLIARRNNLLQEMDKVAHSFEIVQGAPGPSGMPFKLGNRLDENAGKYFIFIRQKLGIAYTRIFKEWILPELVKDLKGQDIIHLTGDVELLKAFRKMAVDSWYIKNLVKIGKHTPEMAETIKAEKMAELEKHEPMIKNTKEIWNDVIKRIHITVTGENSDLSENLATIAELLEYEQDSVRRASLLDRIYAVKNIPLPPAPVPQTAPQVGKVLT